MTPVRIASQIGRSQSAASATQRTIVGRGIWTPWRVR